MGAAGGVGRSEVIAGSNGYSQLDYRQTENQEILWRFGGRIFISVSPCAGQRWRPLKQKRWIWSEAFA
jgi:hypothetical protein